MDSPRSPRISVVVPTFNRKDIVTRALEALQRIDYPHPFEVIVVDDGSSDGTFEALGELELSYQPSILRQKNSGAGAARNAGAAKARGDILLFLDDDMMADPRLLIEHDRALEDWDAAVGRIPVDPDGPESSLKAGLEEWEAARHTRLDGSDSPLLLGDLLTGQLSVKTDVFRRLGGFDGSFNAGGTFGAEDTDFLYRLLQSGAAVGYAAAAISHQFYAVTPTHYIRQWAQGGRADAALVRKHPALRETIVNSHGGRLRHTVLATPLVPTRVVDGLARRIAARMSAGRGGRLYDIALHQFRDALYWRSFDRGERGYRNPELAVLSYHSIGDDSCLKPYDTSAGELRDHIDEMRDHGYSFVSLAETIDYLRGGPLADRSVLMTFDDGYESVYAEARRVLSEAQVPAVAFVVSGEIGGRNSWDLEQGRAPLPLMDIADLRSLHEDDWSIASHTESHAHLTQLTGGSLKRELESSLAALEADDFDAPRILAYPYGEQDLRVRRAAARAGYRFAFAMGGGRASRRRSERLRIPRIEVIGGMTGKDLIAVMEAPAEPRRRHPMKELRALARIAVPSFGVTSHGGNAVPIGFGDQTEAHPK